MVLVFVLTLIWSILIFLDTVTAEKTHDLKAFVTERWQTAQPDAVRLCRQPVGRVRAETRATFTRPTR